MVPVSDIRMLIVDDDPLMRDLLRRSLERMGFTQIYAAPDGAEALPLAQSQRPAVIVSDYEMPTMHGLQLLKAVRQDPDLAGTVFIMLSGAANDAVAEKATELGANGFITKPFFPDDLKQRIDSVYREATGAGIDWTRPA